MNSRIATINSKKSNFCHLSVEKTHWAAAASFSHRSTGFGGNVFTWTASCLTTGLFQHVGEVKTCWVSFSTKMAQHATLYIYIYIVNRYIYIYVYIYMPSKCDLWFYRHEKYVSQTPVRHLSVAKKRFVLMCFFPFWWHTNQLLPGPSICDPL